MKWCTSNRGKVSVINPNSCATSGTERPLFTMATACSRNSAVYSLFKIRFIVTSAKPYSNYATLEA